MPYCAATWEGVGSSPHTWGILKSVHQGGDKRRFIPTYVGHTMGYGTGYSILTVHPHIRGAYVSSVRFLSRTFGSSPHTWGILACHFYCRQSSRFIPTYVGHTGRISPPPPAPTVHPHIRGAYKYAKIRTPKHSGSSPHTLSLIHI